VNELLGKWIDDQGSNDSKAPRYATCLKVQSALWPTNTARIPDVDSENELHWSSNATASFVKDGQIRERPVATRIPGPLRLADAFDNSRQQSESPACAQNGSNSVERDAALCEAN
jgi:hypothetical protein